MTQAPIRLAYSITSVPRTQRVLLLPHLQLSSPPMLEADVRQLRTKLHQLDQPIVQEICKSTVFGQITDTQLARLLPLLAQRRTAIGDQRLRIVDLPLRPRAKVQREAGQIVVTLGLENEDGSWVEWNSGRLLAGSEAFFLVDFRAHPILSPAPWNLSTWMHEPTIKLSGERLQPAGRDTLIRELVAAGVPPQDLDALAVRRGPPHSFVLTITQTQLNQGEPELGAKLEAHYDAGVVTLDSQRSAANLYVEAGETQGQEPAAEVEAEASAEQVPTTEAEPEALDLSESEDEVGDVELTERDIGAEDEARNLMRQVGFMYDKTQGLYVTRGEAALKILDPTLKLFPKHWQIERGNFALKFHQDLRLDTSVQLLEERGLLDLRIRIESVNDDETVAALVDMQELLVWLQSGRRYVRLSDGSFAAPSAKFRQGLRIIKDLGADGDRALISPLCIGLLRAIGDVAALKAVDEATRAWLEEISEIQSPKSVPVPKGLSASLRDYQRRGLDWLMMLHRFRLTGILADDMGLGKTLQSLALLLSVRDSEGSKPSMVIAPTSVVPVWRDEAMRFAPDLKVVTWYGAPEIRRTLPAQDADLIVTSYGILRRDVEIFEKINFRYVILDEAQNTKNASSHNAHAIRRLKSERRLALSGTPLENRPEELWSIFDFLAPGFLGSLRYFRKTYVLAMNKQENDVRGLLRMRLQPLILRRLKQQVASDLPDKIESTMRCEMGSAQRALYEHVAGELRASIKEKISKVGIESAQMDILAALTRLRQICCDPALLPIPNGVKTPASAKLELFEELIREALDSDRAIVVFSQFVQMQRRIIDVVRKLGVEPLWLHGGTKNRDKVVANFQDPKGPPVIVVSLRAGGTGLTLTRADTVVHYDPWWNPAVERQATDRAHRLGQKKVVSVYRLICANSIEERVLALAERKEALAQELLASEGGAGAKQISSEEVLALFA